MKEKKKLPFFGLGYIMPYLAKYKKGFAVMILGALAGSFITFNTEGIEFVMTAMFVVIFLEGWLKEKNHISSLIGIVASVVCLLVFGKNSFLIPTMACIIALLSVLKGPITGRDKK